MKLNLSAFELHSAGKTPILEPTICLDQKGASFRRSPTLMKNFLRNSILSRLLLPVD